MFIFSHQGFKIIAQYWNSKKFDFVCTDNGGNQNVTCRDSDSTLLQSLIIDQYQENIYLTSGKDLDNRFFTQQLPESTSMPRMAVVGRSGNSPQSKAL